MYDDTKTEVKCECQALLAPRQSELFNALARSSRNREEAAWLICVLLAGCAIVPGQTLGGFVLQRDTLPLVLASDMAVEARDLKVETVAELKCKNRRIANTEVIEQPLIVPDHQGRPMFRHVERWIVDRCGKLVLYRVEYSSYGRGTSIKVKPEE